MVKVRPENPKNHTRFLNSLYIYKISQEKMLTPTKISPLTSLNIGSNLYALSKVHDIVKEINK